jgi:hypothetical protein
MYFLSECYDTKFDFIQTYFLFLSVFIALNNVSIYVYTVKEDVKNFVKMVRWFM